MTLLAQTRVVVVAFLDNDKRERSPWLLAHSKLTKLAWKWPPVRAARLIERVFSCATLVVVGLTSCRIRASVSAALITLTRRVAAFSRVSNLLSIDIHRQPSQTPHRLHNLAVPFAATQPAHTRGTRILAFYPSVGWRADPVGPAGNSFVLELQITLQPIWRLRIFNDSTRTGKQLIFQGRQLSVKPVCQLKPLFVLPQQVVESCAKTTHNEWSGDGDNERANEQPPAPPNPIEARSRPN